MGQHETAKQIWDFFITKGWSKEAIAGMLGNMQSESEIMADCWESGKVGNMNVGYGLVQWTPATKYIDWAKNNELVYQDVISQCKRIEWEVVNKQQWIHPSMTFRQFTQLTSSPEQCALLFITHYERPLNPNQPKRQTQARYWYNQFVNESGNETTKKGGNMMLLFKQKNEEAIYWLVGNQYTHISGLTALKLIKDMMVQAGYDTHIHTDATQIAYIKKVATEKK